MKKQQTIYTAEQMIRTLLTIPPKTIIMQGLNGFGLRATFGNSYYIQNSYGEKILRMAGNREVESNPILTPNPVPLLRLYTTTRISDNSKLATQYIMEAINDNRS